MSSGDHGGDEGGVMLTIARSRLLRIRHVLGTGQALDNARRERDANARCLAQLSVLEARLTATRAAAA
jgi:hypothetical protein